MSLPHLAAINQATWERVQPRAVALVVDASDSRPPLIGVRFGNHAEAQRLFSHWQSRFGSDDEHGVIHIAIVEGKTPSGEGRAALVLGTSMGGLSAWAKATNTVQPEYLATFSGAVRTTPKSVDLFRDAVERWGGYDLIPIQAGPGGVEFDEPSLLHKRHIGFFAVEQVRDVPGDPNAAALPVFER